MKVRCEACGAEYENPASMICDNCGMRMSRTVTKVEEKEPDYASCPQCGTRNKGSAKLCINCGNLIRDRSL